MTTKGKATVVKHGNQYYVHVYNEYYKAMEELGPYDYWQARAKAAEINNKS